MESAVACCRRRAHGGGPKGGVAQTLDYLAHYPALGAHLPQTAISPDSRFAAARRSCTRYKYIDSGLRPGFRKRCRGQSRLLPFLYFPSTSTSTVIPSRNLSVSVKAKQHQPLQVLSWRARSHRRLRLRPPSRRC